VLVVFLFIIGIHHSGFSSTLTGPEIITPGMEEISRCVPETMQENVREAIKDLTKAGKITKELYKLVSKSFAKNCKKLAEQLKNLEIDELLNEENITCKFNEQDKDTLVAMLKDQNTGLQNFLYILENLDVHFLGYISILHAMLNKDLKLDVIDLIHTIDLIQRSALEMQENLQLLSYLKFAHDNVDGYGVILEGIRHQFSFKIMTMINALNTITEDLRVTYLSLLDKGGCSADQVITALGLRQKKIRAIEAED
jgi:polyhydroxyalkanoate synthesis regulator phasin